MAVTYTWNGYLDTGTMDEVGQVFVQVYTCSVCYANVSDEDRTSHTEYHEPTPPDPEPEPEPDPDEPDPNP